MVFIGFVYHPYCRLQTADSGLGKAVPEMVSRQAVKLYCELPLGHWRQAGSPPEDIWQWALYMTSWPWGPGVAKILARIARTRAMAMDRLQL